nr:hypothetical protein [Mesomycoplasma hyopneumoniae]
MIKFNWAFCTIFFLIINEGIIKKIDKKTKKTRKITRLFESFKGYVTSKMLNEKRIIG